MPLTVRTIVTVAIPTLAALFGIFWFRRKKKPPAIEGPNLCKEENNIAASKTGKSEKNIQTWTHPGK